MPIQTLMLACFFFFLFVYCNVFFLSFTLRTVDSRGKQNSTLLSYPHLYSCFIDLAIIKGKYSLKLPRHIRTLKTSLLETTGRSELAVPELARSESAYRHLVITLSLISLFLSSVISLGHIYSFRFAFVLQETAMEGVGMRNALLLLGCMFV